MQTFPTTALPPSQLVVTFPHHGGPQRDKEHLNSTEEWEVRKLRYRVDSASEVKVTQGSELKVLDKA